MAGKKVNLGSRPTPVATITSDWVDGKMGEPAARLIVAIPRLLQVALKYLRVLRSTKMAVEIRGLLEAKYRREIRRLIGAAIALSCCFFPETAAIAKDRWTVVAEDVDTNQVQLVNLVSARRIGPIVSVWVLMNHPKDSDNAESEMGFHEYNCRERRWRSNALRITAEKFGRGKAIQSLDTPNTVWRPLVPESIGEMTADFVCKRVKA